MGVAFRSMRSRWAVPLLLTLLLLTFCGGASASACRRATSEFGAPDNACSPGAYVVLSRRAVCAAKDRPGLPAAERRRLLSDYGVPGWTGRSGEIDHRVPVFLGGLTVRRNLWPEPGSIPNPKDRLEFAVRRRVCDGVPHPMRVRTAVRLFLADWRHAYRAFFG